MLDKLTVTSPEVVSIEQACKQLNGLYSSYTSSGSKYHHAVISFNKSSGIKGDYLLTLHLGPRHSQISPMKLELNPSRFKGFKALCDLVSLLAAPATCKVTRVDHTVDLPDVSVQQVNRSLIFSRKKSREVYRNGVELTGLYLGKNPELLAVYDKAREKGVPGTMTRIELRQYRERVPVQSFMSLPTLVEYKPFSKLKFQRLISEPVGIRDSQKMLSLKEWLNRVGAQGSFKALNRHSNFKRDYQPLFETDPLIPNLNEIYQKNLIRYFN